ncbi:MAG: hypothetical protein ACE5PO_09590 [Candidatus Bathyarchaeia archaeon]
MSEPQITLRIKTANFEIQLEGPRETLLDMTDKDLPKIVEAVSKLVAPPPTPQPSAITAQPQPAVVEAAPGAAEPPPTVTADSCGDAILALMNTPWGRAKPRCLSEIKDALEANALHYSGKVIGFTLTRLTRKQKLRRWKTDDGYVYTGPTSETAT